MRILGIDPGTVIVGYGCLEVVEREQAALGAAGARIKNLVRSPSHQRVRVVEAGALRLGRGEIVDRLGKLLHCLDELLTRLRPDELALEEAFHGKSAQAALRIGEARGVVIAEARRHGVAVFQFPPARIKQSLTGHGGAGKDHVADMARRTLGLAAAPQPRDVSDALAVALCRMEARRTFPGVSACKPQKPRV